MNIQVSPHVSTADIADGLVLLDERKGRYWQLNATGALILRSLLNGASLDEATELVTTRYEVDSDQAASDAAALLESLKSAGLVKL